MRNSVYLDDGPYALNPSAILVFWVDASGFGDFRRVLAASTNLTELDVEFAGGSGSDQEIPVDDVIPLPNLIHMSLVDENRALLVHLLERLTCPKLQKLSAHNTYSFLVPDSIGILYAVTSDLLLAFYKFLERSCPPLCDLELQYHVEGPIPSDSPPECSVILRRILRQLNDLERLILEGFVIDDQLIQEMTFKEGGTVVICPLLTEIRMICEGSDVLSRSVADMAVSRWRVGKAMKYLELGISDLEDIGEIYPDVKQCMDEGLRFSCLNHAGVDYM